MSDLIKKAFNDVMTGPTFFGDSWDGMDAGWRGGRMTKNKLQKKALKISDELTRSEKGGGGPTISPYGFVTPDRSKKNPILEHNRLHPKSYEQQKAEAEELAKRKPVDEWYEPWSEKEDRGMAIYPEDYQKGNLGLGRYAMKKGGTIEDALRLAKQGKIRLHQSVARMGYKTGGKPKEIEGYVDVETDYMRPFKELDPQTKAEVLQRRRHTFSPPTNTGPTTPHNQPTVVTPRFAIPTEEYMRGNLGGDKYALAKGGVAERKGYAVGGNPTDLTAGATPATDLTSSAAPATGIAIPQTAVDNAATVANTLGTATPPTTDPYQSYVDSLYQNILGRKADTGGEQYWTNQLDTGATTTQDILNSFAGSKEFQDLYSSNPSQAVSNLYQTALGRAPEQAGLQYWTQQAQGGPNQAAYQQAQDKYNTDLQNYNQQMSNYNNAQNNYSVLQFLNQAYGDQTIRSVSQPVAPNITKPVAPNPTQFTQGPLSATQLLSQFETAPEFQNRDAILNDYINYAGQAPTADQYASAANAIAGGKTLSDVTASISASPEATQNLVNTAYQGLLGRAPDKGGQQYWTDQLNSGKATPQDLINAIASSTEGTEYANEQTLNGLYMNALGRAPTQEEQNKYLPDMAQNKITQDQIQQTLAKDPEAQNFQNQQLVNDTYQAFMGRQPTQAEINNPKSSYNDYMSKLAAGTLDSNSLAAAITSTPESKQYQLNNNINPQEYGPVNAKAANGSVPQDSTALQDYFGPIEQAAGLPTGTMLAMSGIESTYGTNQHRAGSQYEGMMQMGKNEQKTYGVQNPYNWQQNALGAAKYMVANGQTFTKLTGQQPQRGDYYGMHQQGAGGWSRVVNSPNGNAAATIGYQKLIQNLPNNLRGQASKMTNAQFRDFILQKVNSNLGGPDGKGFDILNLNPDGTTKTAPSTPTTPDPNTQGSIAPPNLGQQLTPNLGQQLAASGAGGNVQGNTNAGAGIIGNAGTGIPVTTSGIVNPPPYSTLPNPQTLVQQAQISPYIVTSFDPTVIGPGSSGSIGGTYSGGMPANYTPLPVTSGISMGGGFMSKGGRTNSSKKPNLGRTDTMHDDIKHALRLALGRKHYANGGSGTCNASSSSSFTPFLDNLYQQDLGRAADQGGEEYWANQMANGMSPEQVAASFYNSQEAQNRRQNNPQMPTQTLGLGQAAYNNLPPSMQAQAQSCQPNPAQPAMQLMGGGCSTPQGFYGNRGMDGNRNNNFINNLYQQDLGRAPDQSGGQYWLQQIQSGAMTPQQVAQNFANSSEAKSYQQANPNNQQFQFPSGRNNFGGYGNGTKGGYSMPSQPVGGVGQPPNIDPALLQQMRGQMQGALGQNQGSNGTKSGYGMPQQPYTGQGNGLKNGYNPSQPTNVPAMGTGQPIGGGGATPQGYAQANNIPYPQPNAQTTPLNAPAALGFARGGKVKQRKHKNAKSKALSVVNKFTGRE